MSLSAEDRFYFLSEKGASHAELDAAGVFRSTTVLRVSLGNVVRWSASAQKNSASRFFPVSRQPRSSTTNKVPVRVWQPATMESQDGKPTDHFQPGVDFSASTRFLQRVHAVISAGS